MKLGEKTVYLQGQILATHKVLMGQLRTRCDDMKARKQKKALELCLRAGIIVPARTESEIRSIAV